MTRLLVLTAGAALLLAGCAQNDDADMAADLPNPPQPRLNASIHGNNTEPSALQGTFAYMADNALLADMSVGDRHFLPHRNELSMLGVRRLSRLAGLMDAYGGTVRFSTNVTDPELIANRTETISQFLADAGIDTTQNVIERNLPGGDGMRATEAILIKAKLGTFDPEADTNKEPDTELP